MSRALAAAMAAQVPSQEPEEAPPSPNAPPSPDDETSSTSSSYQARVALTPDIAAVPASSQTEPTVYSHRVDEGDTPVATPAQEMHDAAPAAHAASHATRHTAGAPQTPPRPARVPQLSPPPPLPPQTPPTPPTPPAMGRMYDTTQCTAFGAALATRPHTSRFCFWRLCCCRALVVRGFFAMY